MPANFRKQPYLRWVGEIVDGWWPYFHYFFFGSSPYDKFQVRRKRLIPVFPFAPRKIGRRFVLRETAGAGLLLPLSCAPNRSSELLRAPLSAPDPKYAIPPSSSFVSWPPRRACPVRPTSTGWQSVSPFHGRTLPVWNRGAPSGEG